MNLKLKAVSKEKLLGISFDTTLSCRKLHALARIAHYTDFEKRRSLMKAFVISQFNYCPLVWLFHNRTLNNRITKTGLTTSISE